MASRALSALLLAALACDVAYAKFGRHSFPEDFIFGTGSAAYQYEGAYKEGGKGPSVCDTFSHIPGKIKNNDTGDVAVDFYHRYKEDVKLLKDMNMDAFRFSIAWTRILPRFELVVPFGGCFDTSLGLGGRFAASSPWRMLCRWDLGAATEAVQP
ncbi:hypothetical protein PVAP13_2KG392305 [Panicum virgatum]|uniref:Uncharacterized protein n=1 Tax=Panicum virgatum TaxID=38727 RepID=A0A8T0WBA8_PANVG|nr:hypothetical protein PVAP13_2KG392305 [Panicum virgatum]